MSPLAKVSQTTPAPYELLKVKSKGASAPHPVIQATSNNVHEIFGWKRLTESLPMVYILQPDFYAVFRISSPGTPVFQQNLRLDLGAGEVRFEMLLQQLASKDMDHLKRIDHVVHQFAIECRLEPFDYICSTVCRWNGPDASPKYLLRKTAILQIDARGVPCYGLMTFQDITSLVSASRPNNTDITFLPEKAHLSYELSKRILAVQPNTVGITDREKEILVCLYKGMSSKEIASTLFISKATVDTHRQNLIRKCEVPNTAALLKNAVEKGLI